MLSLLISSLDMDMLETKGSVALNFYNDSPPREALKEVFRESDHVECVLYCNYGFSKPGVRHVTRVLRVEGFNHVYRFVRIDRRAAIRAAKAKRAAK